MQLAPLVFKNGKYNFSISLEAIENTDIQQKFHSAVNQQFNAFLPAVDGKSALEFILTDHLGKYFTAKNWLNIGDIRYSEKEKLIGFQQQGISFVYSNQDGCHKIFFQIEPYSGFKKNCRFLNKSFLDSIEHQVSLFYYRIFLLFSQLVNIEYNTTYIHGATVSDSAGNAILFPADSGVGKSSMLFKMSLESEYYYIADDLSIISTEGECYYSGRAISTKPYHLSNFDHLKELLDRHMPFLQKVQWKLLNDNRLVYGLRPKTLFKGKISKQASIKTVVHLINTNEKEFSLQTSDADTLASASANILMNELILCYSIVYKALSISGNTLMESPGNIYKKTHNWYKDIFSTMDLYILKVPYMSHPEKMYDFLVKNGILK